MYSTRNSFDLLRISASTLVMLSHSFALTGVREPRITSDCTLGTVAVYFFFSISGYLVYPSLERDPHVLRFLARRALRIFPGLAVVLALTVLVVGPVCSSLPAQDYFAQSETWAYLAKIRLYGSDRLPGVFERNPYPLAINSSLWTLKLEWLMYCALAILALVPRRRHVPLVLLALGGLLAIVGAGIATDGIEGLAVLKAAGLSRIVADFAVLGCFFLTGSLLAIVRRSVRPSMLWTLLVCGVATPLLGTSMGLLGLMAAVPLLVATLGESSLQQRLGINVRHDLSYGIYIYAFPIQQMIAMTIPGIRWHLAFAIALIATLVTAYLSWRFVEAPGLSLKNALKSRLP